MDVTQGLHQPRDASRLIQRAPRHFAYQVRRIDDAAPESNGCSPGVGEAMLAQRVDKPFGVICIKPSFRKGRYEFGLF
jgi:hypothetical protein